MSDYFGEHDSRRMPSYLFADGAHLAHDRAVRADIAKQNYSVCPRHWYVDATICCVGCGNDYVFTIDEQRFWYEELAFYVDSFPTRCNHCRRTDRQMRDLRNTYDRDIADALESRDSTAKRELVAVIDAMRDGGISLPRKIQEAREALSRQIQNMRGD